MNTNRNFIGIENNLEYFNISTKRVNEKELTIDNIDSSVKMSFLI